MEKETTVQEEVVEKPVDVNAIIEDAISNLNNDKYSVYFYAPPMNSPSGGVAVLLRLAKSIADSGVATKIVYEPMLNERASQERSIKEKAQMEIFEVFNPSWVDFDISKIEFIPLGDKEIEFTDGKKVKCSPLTVRNEDMLIIPEGFPNIMQKTVQISCKRIVLAQSWFYVLNSMEPGQKWQHFGIKDVISVSDAITDYLNAVIPGLSIKRLHQGIDRETFKPPTKKSEKFPMVGFSSTRGPENKMKTYNIIKMFYAIYPHLKWVRFKELVGMDREQFAEQLSHCAFYLYTDDIAGFGTAPLEAMACDTHIVGFAPYGGREYINANNGFWSGNGDIFGTAELLGVAIDKWLNGEMDSDEIKNEYTKTLEPYSVEGEKTKILEIINEYKKERIDELTGLKKK